MKKIIFVFVCLFISNNNVFAISDSVVKCRANLTNTDYWKENSSKQIDESKLDGRALRDAKIRNLCYRASNSWHNWCSWKQCGVEDKWLGRNLEQYCDFAKVDCFTENIDTIFQLLQEAQSSLLDLFLPDMNKITESISDNTEEIGVLDIDSSVCYRIDDNGDTIWHVFIKNNKNPKSWWNQCVSFLKTDNLQQELVNATYKTKNKNGNTAVQEAIKTGGNSRAQYLLQAMSYYYTQEKLDCNALASDISASNNISFNEAKELIQQCH